MIEHVDVAVIGGGIAGASAAYEIAQSATTLVLEAEPTCDHHTTGRSAAIFTECYGDAVVRRLAIASRAFLGSPPVGFSDGEVLTPRSILFAAMTGQELALEAAYADFSALVPGLAMLDVAGAVERCPVLRPARLCGAVLEPLASDIDVHALHQGYLRGARRRGADVRTSVPVDRIERSGSAWEVTAARCRVRAEVVVNAAGAWCDRVASMAGVRPIGLVPKRRTAFTFDPPRGNTHRKWPLVIDLAERFYFKPDGALMLASPADETPMEPCDVRHTETDVAMGIERIESATTLRIRTVRHAWAGLRSFVSDKRPVAGFATDAPGFLWLAGQGGYGIKTSRAMGLAAAGLVIDGSMPAELEEAGITADDLGAERLSRV